MHSSLSVRHDSVEKVHSDGMDRRYHIGTNRDIQKSNPNRHLLSISRIYNSSLSITRALTESHDKYARTRRCVAPQLKSRSSYGIRILSRKAERCGWWHGPNR